MIVVFGTTHVGKALGAVADFCPVCRNVREFSLVSVKEYSHLFWVSLVPRRFVGHVIVCRDCGLELPSSVDAYKGVLHEPAGIEELVEETNPSLGRRLAGRLEIEDLLRARGPQSLAPDLRVDLLMESFGLFAPQIERLSTLRWRFDSRAMTILFLSLVGIALGVNAPLVSNPILQNCGYVALALTVLVGFPGFLVALLRAPRRTLNNFILPGLARALRPLEPTEDEIEHCLKALKKERSPVARFVKSKRLWEELGRTTAQLEAVVIRPDSTARPR